MEALSENKALFTNSQNTANRLHLYCGVEAKPLYAPPPLHEQLKVGAYGDYLFFVGRLDRIKRLGLAIQALTYTRNAVRLRIAGSGPDLDRLEDLVAELGLDDRVDFLGFTTDADLLELIAGCFAMVLTPLDEDYGFTTLEAFFAGRPIVTTTDAGGVLEFVREGETGFVVEPDPVAVADRIDLLYEDRGLCERLGHEGREMVQDRVSWPKAIAALTSTLE